MHNYESHLLILSGKLFMCNGIVYIVRILRLI